ncbi:MAG: ArsR/SmtB family transcription factor [Solirubrobacterales bacterium]
MSETNPEAIEERLARALSHPLRVQIFEILSERIASPHDLSQELGVELTHIAYHTRTLDRCGCLELVDTAQRRGATEHYYRTAARTGLRWIPLDLDEKGWEEVASILEQTQRRVRAAQRRTAARRLDGARPAPSVVALATLV